MENSKLVLAEIIGIMLGDGCFSEGSRCYQISVSFHKKEKKYLRYVLNLFKQFFPEEKFHKYELKDQMIIRTYSKKVADVFLKNGLKTGNKTKRDILIPTWIASNKSSVIAFLRGLFDTDGCIYRKYGKYLQIQMKLANKTLVKDIQKTLDVLGFNPTKVIPDFCKMYKVPSWKFYLSRQSEIHKFIKEIGFRNFKHINRYVKLLGRSYNLVLSQ